MRVRPETLLIATLGVFACSGVAAVLLVSASRSEALVDPGLVEPLVSPEFVDPADVPAAAVSGVRWFEEMRSFCNPLDVETRMRWQPAPDTEDGSMYAAACYALAGRIDLARPEVLRLPAERRYHAAGVIFDAGHPAADAGDELAAGPLMELVVEFWPNHYMALYHAGAAAHERGDRLVARGYLERFLQEYAIEDGWRSSAQEMLEADRR